MAYHRSRPELPSLLRLYLIPLLLCLAIFLSPLAASATPPARTVETTNTTKTTTFVLDAIDISGNQRTSLNTVHLYLPLRPGAEVDQAEIIAGVESLRRSDLFAEVDYYTRPGSARGHLILALEVVEKKVEFRLGTGNTDLDGWYLIPAELAMDNRLGRGERMNLQMRLGYRHAGIFYNLSQSRLGGSSGYWGMRAYHLDSDRLYFFRQTEISHQVARSAAEVTWGRQLSRHFAGEIGMGVERIDADSVATVYSDNEQLGLEINDELAWEDLPAAVASDAGVSKRTRLHLELRLDSRSRQQIAGSPSSGLWGRVRVAGTLQGDDSFAALQTDLRGYQKLLGGVLAGRLRGGLVGEKAAFYDRLYLGGLYTVRGFPSQSLTGPAGDTWLWSASCEFRAPLLGPRARPRLAGLLFIDAGQTGTGNETKLRQASAAVGYGIRLRVAWLGWLGLDFGIPLTDNPVDDAFHAHGSIGWGVLMPGQGIKCRWAWRLELLFFQLGMLLSATVPGALAEDDQPRILTVEPAQQGELLVCHVTTSGLPGEKASSSMQSGLISSVELFLDLLDERQRVLAENHITFELAFDLWEEIFTVQLPGQEHRFTDHAALADFLTNLPRLPVAHMSHLQPGDRYRVRAGLRLLPLAASSRTRAEDVIAGEASDDASDDPNATFERGGSQEITFSLGRLIKFFYRGSEDRPPIEWPVLSSWFQREELDDAQD